MNPVDTDGTNENDLNLNHKSNVKFSNIPAEMPGVLTKYMTTMPVVEALPGDFLDCFKDVAMAAARNVDLADSRIAQENPGLL